MGRRLALRILVQTIVQIKINKNVYADRGQAAYYSHTNKAQKITPIGDGKVVKKEKRILPRKLSKAGEN